MCQRPLDLSPASLRVVRVCVPAWTDKTLSLGCLSSLLLKTGGSPPEGFRMDRLFPESAGIAAKLHTRSRHRHSSYKVASILNLRLPRVTTL